LDLLGKAANGETLNWITIGGLVGLTLVITVSGVFDAVRDWMQGFKVPINPLRILGDVLASTIAVGFCVGVIWGITTGHSAVLVGGLIALAAAGADEALALAHGIVRRVLPMRSPPPMMQPPIRERPRPVTGKPLTEDEVHAEMDRKDEEHAP